MCTAMWTRKLLVGISSEIALPPRKPVSYSRLKMLTGARVLKTSLWRGSTHWTVPEHSPIPWIYMHR